jgi:hypothetical protein
MSRKRREPGPDADPVERLRHFCRQTAAARGQALARGDLVTAGRLGLRLELLRHRLARLEGVPDHGRRPEPDGEDDGDGDE